MTQLISIITPVHKPAAHYLPDAYASLTAQELPDGWDWQWLIQEDGQAGATSFVPDDTRIEISGGKARGAAVARNMALGRARGDLVKVLDSDDQLTPGALARDIRILLEKPELGWTTSRVLDFLPDGSTKSWEHSDPAGGPFTRTHVLNYFRQHNYRLPIHPATLCIRKSLVLALGGWMALPGGEDTALLLAASVLSDGYFIHEPGLLYRKWEGQITASPEWTEKTEWTARMEIIEARAASLLKLGRIRLSNLYEN